MPIHNGQSHIVGPLHGLAAPQHQSLCGLCAQAQLKAVTLQRLLAGGQRAGQGLHRWQGWVGRHEGRGHRAGNIREPTRKQRGQVDRGTAWREMGGGQDKG